MTSQTVITVLKRALNLLDYHIVDHGQRVMYITYKMLKKDNIYSRSDLSKICFLCVLHDIGAFKTEQIDTLDEYAEALKFDMRNTKEHSVYGYLFLKKFSILSDFATAILYHHVRYDRMMESSCTNKDLAAKLFLADRIDSISELSKLKIDADFFYEYRDTVFSAHDIDLLIEIEKEEHLQEKLSSGEYQQELELIYSQAVFTEKELYSFLKTLAYFIDFRSQYTVIHTIATVKFSVEIARRMGLTDDECQKIYYGSLVHDVGKISTPVAVLEKSERLDDIEYRIIKDHVVMSEFILKDCVDDDILQIAIRHHEKLDGSGYHKGLSGKDLTLPQRIVCVADILSALYGKRSYKDSYPAEKIQAILRDMVQRRQLSEEVVSLVLKDYDSIIEEVEINCKKSIEDYQQMNTQFQMLCQKLDI